MSADNRTPHTDALATLGMIHTKKEGRDAIHLGVEQVVAGMELEPGDHVGFGPDGKVYSWIHNQPIKHVGIVDPFLDEHTTIYQGQKFWLVVYPRQITSLRHVWEHPDFPASGETGQAMGRTPEEQEEAEHQARLLIGDPVAEAKEHLRGVANNLGVDYDDLMFHAKQKTKDQWHYWSEGGRFEGETIGDTTKFWDAYNKVTGSNEPNHGGLLSCSC